MATRFCYLHGFASGPSSRKAQFFRAEFEKRNLTLDSPDLANGDFTGLTISGQLALLERLLENQPAILIGSSLGGYLAALYASLHPEVERLLLLAPAFGFARRWPRLLGDVEMERWRSEGRRPVYHYAERQERMIGYQLIEDGLRYPDHPAVTQPTLICHGRSDDVVPPLLSEEFAESCPTARLLLFDTGHEMTDALESIWAASQDFLLGPYRTIELKV